MKKPEVIKFLAIITAFFPDRKITDEMIAGWHIMLEDMPYELAEQALKAVLSNTRFFPTVSEIREEAAKIARPIPAASEAWREAVSEMIRVGNIGKPEFSDPLIAQAVKAMGWFDMCKSENKDVLRGQFMKIYTSVASQEQQRIQLPTSVLKMTEASRRQIQSDSRKELSE